MNLFYEKFTQFLENPRREDLRDILIINFGESNYLDFKREWPSHTKVAQHILALANSGGGCIVFGVSETDDVLEPVGLTTIEDKASIYNRISPFLPNEIEWDILDFKYSESEYAQLKGKKFQVLFVRDKPEYLPYVTEKTGDGITESKIYVRRGTSSVEANHQELQALINRRIETGYSSTSELKLEEHISQLKVLFSNIDKYKYSGGSLSVSINELINASWGRTKYENPYYPEESFDEFIAKMIEIKKKRIKSMIEV